MVQRRELRLAEALHHRKNRSINEPNISVRIPIAKLANASVVLTLEFHDRVDEAQEAVASKAA